MEGSIVIDGKSVLKYVFTIEEILRIKSPVDWEKDIMDKASNEVMGFFSLPVTPNVILLSKMAKISFAQYIVNNQNKYGPKYMDWVGSLLYGEEICVLNVAGHSLFIMTMNPEQA